MHSMSSFLDSKRVPVISGREGFECNKILFFLHFLRIKIFLELGIFKNNFLIYILRCFSLFTVKGGLILVKFFRFWFFNGLMTGERFRVFFGFCNFSFVFWLCFLYFRVNLRQWQCFQVLLICIPKIYSQRQVQGIISAINCIYHSTIYVLSKKKVQRKVRKSVFSPKICKKVL